MQTKKANVNPHSTFNRPAPSINEQMEVFNFSESQTEIRSLQIEGNPHFVGRDIAIALGYDQPHKAIQRHCRYGTKHTIPHPQSPTKQLEVLVIPESDMYRLIINSELPSAQKFERWVMEEVLPSLRKKGYYKLNAPKNDYIDARDVPYGNIVINNYNVTTIRAGAPANDTLYLINDLCRSIQSTTSSGQIVKKLNAKRPLAWKVWLFGHTNPAWFTNELGMQLIFSGSRIERNRTQYLLPANQGGAS